MTESASQPPAVILITGIMAAGKSTVAEALARRLPRSVHLRGDVFRKMIVNGRAEMTSDAPDEALRQLRSSRPPPASPSYSRMSSSAPSCRR